MMHDGNMALRMQKKKKSSMFLSLDLCKSKNLIVSPNL